MDWMYCQNLAAAGLDVHINQSHMLATGAAMISAVEVHS